MQNTHKSSSESPLFPIHRSLFILVWLAWCCFPCLSLAANPLATGTENMSASTIYVPVYSHIFHGDSDSPFLLSVTLSIRNIDPRREITIVSAGYFDLEGKLVRQGLEKPLRLRPLAATYCRVAETDVAGGVNASFLVKWLGEPSANPPLVEAVMIGAAGQQGISFTSRGVPLSPSN